MPARGSGMTQGMLERQLVLAHDENVRLKREVELARSGAIQIPVVTPGQMNEIRAAAAQLQQSADAAQALADSVISWADQLEQFVTPPNPPASNRPEEQPTT